jgi:hypothetical protein
MTAWGRWFQWRPVAWWHIDAATHHMLEYVGRRAALGRHSTPIDPEPPTRRTEEVPLT